MDLLLNFHFIRPFCLLLFLPAGWLAYKLLQARLNNTGFEEIISPNLVPYLTLGKAQAPSTLPLIILSTIWAIGIIALAGPTWEKKPQPLFQSRSAVVIVLDLSPSMRAEDIRPSRIVRAHIKIQDLLKENKEGLHGLVVYAGEAFIATPLSEDNRTITNLLPTLQPGILPIPGSNVEMAIAFAVDLSRKSGIEKASLLLITDGIASEAISSIVRILPNNIDLTILGIGTEKGAPIPSSKGPLKDNDGNVVIATYNDDAIKELASLTNGYYLPLQADNSDIQFFQKHLEQLYINTSQESKNERSTDLWNELGPTLLTLILPFAALAFRRGVLLSTVIILSNIMLNPQPSYAQSFLDKLWKNGDQRGEKAWKNEDYLSAAEAFNDPQWKASAHYKNENYQDALLAFSQDNSAIGHYNRGNTLAMLKKYEESLLAYKQALEIDPKLRAAQINKKRVEDFLKDQQSQKSSTQSDNNQNQSEINQQSLSNDTVNPTGNESTGQQEQLSQQKNLANTKEKDEINKENTDQYTEQRQAKKSEQTVKGSSTDQLTEEEKQSLQQWLQKVPDDPSGLLRRKFQYEFQKRRELYQKGQWTLPENNAHNRY